jgi:hypothetical protein
MVLALAVVAFHCGSWRYAAAQGPGASPGPTTPVLAETARGPLPAAPAPPTPWDIFLACRAEPLPASVKTLCELRLPVIGRDFTRTELNEWAAAVASAPPVGAIDAARTQAEQSLVETAKNVSRAIAGNHEFSFAEGADTLGTELQQHMRRHAAAAAAAFAADSQPIEVLGFADYAQDTPDPNNRALAERRAHHVAAFFRGAGIPSDSIRVKAVLVRNPSGSDAVGQPYRKVAIGGTLSTLAPSPAPGDGISGLSPAELMAGASDFLIERAKEELQTYIMRVGVDRICAGAGTTWKTMLPATCALLPVSGDTSRYIPGPTTLQEALRTDLRQMPYSIAEETLGSLAASVGGTSGSRITAALVLVRYLRSVAEGAEPLATLATWQTARFRFGAHDLSIPETIQKVGTVADLARSARADLGAQVSGAALGDSVALYVLRALVVRGGPEFSGSVWSGWASGANVPRINSALHAVRTAQYVAKEVEEGWTALRNTADDSAAADARAAVVAEVVSAATSLFAVNLGSGTHGSAVLGDSLLEPARDMVLSLTRGNSRAALTSLVRLVQVGADNRSARLSSDYTRLLGFVNDASQARTVDEFSGALESLVGVQGGYLSKRESRTRRYARLNAYVGGNVGVEGAESDGAGLALGLSVPVGVEFGRSTSVRSSNGVFLQFIDLGAVASTRLGGNGEVESLPEFSPGSVIGPGIFWTHGLKDSPLAAALGIAYFPQGREREDGERIGAVRTTLMLAIDIPLFP